MYKLIALDIDGTLLNDDKVITAKTKQVLIHAQKNGMRLALASGRPSAGLVNLAQQLQLDKHNGLLLSYNGGKVIEATTGKVLYEKSIPNQLAVKLIRKLERYDVVPFVDDEQNMYVTDANGFQVQYETTSNNLLPYVVSSVADELERRAFSPVKVLIAAPPEYLQPRIAELKEGFNDDLEFILSTPFYLEATMNGINKAFSLRQSYETLGICSDEIIAFGDAQNDYEMLKSVGLGIAMGNACNELKAIANDITLSNNEDGIAFALEKHIFYEEAIICG